MKLIKKIMFQLPIQDVLSISYQFSVIHLWMIQPLFSCLVFFMRAVHRDNSAPLLNQEHNTFHVLRPKHLDIAPFPMLFLLSGIQPTTAFKTARKTHLRLTAVSKFSHLSHPHPLLHLHSKRSLRKEECLQVGFKHEYAMWSGLTWKLVGLMLGEVAGREIQLKGSVNEKASWPAVTMQSAYVGFWRSECWRRNGEFLKECRAAAF